MTVNHTDATALPETDVPEDDRPVPRCQYCDRPFRRVRERDLHVGEVHADACTDEERTAYERADGEEVDELFLYHMKVVAAIALIYSGFVIVYMVLAG